MTLGPPEPEEYARHLLRELKLDRINNLDDLLTPLRLSIAEKRASKLEGALVCRRNRSKGVIVLSDAIREEGRRRFTVCHEVAHFILPGHGDSGCSSSAIESWREASDRKEVDANRLASELLLPTKLIYPLVSKKTATIKLAKSLSHDFNTSLTAAAYKITELTEEPCAVIWSIGGDILWFKKNENFRGYIARGRLDDQSYAARLIKGASEREAEGMTYCETWLAGDNLSGKDKVWEDSIYLPNYEAVLTILTLDNG